MNQFYPIFQQEVKILKENTVLHLSVFNVLFVWQIPI